MWFGEPLPADVIQAAADAAANADVFLTVGTSAVVYPAAALTEIAVGCGAAAIEVNLQPTPASRLVRVALHGKAGDILPRLLAEAVTVRRTTVGRRTWMARGLQGSTMARG